MDFYTKVSSKPSVKFEHLVEADEVDESGGITNEDPTSVSLLSNGELKNKWQRTYTHEQL